MGPDEGVGLGADKVRYEVDPQPLLGPVVDLSNAIVCLVGVDLMQTLRVLVPLESAWEGCIHGSWVWRTSGLAS